MAESKTASLQTVSSFICKLPQRDSFLEITMMILRKMKTKPRINISFQARTKFPFGQNVWVKIDGQFKSRRIYVKVVTRSRRDVFYTF